MQSSLDADDAHEMFTDGLDRYLKSRSGDIPSAIGAIPSRIWNDLAEMGVMGLSLRLSYSPWVPLHHDSRLRTKGG
jgi:hypothetical protein